MMPFPSNIAFAAPARATHASAAQTALSLYPTLSPPIVSQRDMAHIRDDGRVLFFPPAEQDDRRRRRCSAIIFHPEKARAAMVSYMRRKRAPPASSMGASRAHFEKWCSIK